jgi:hypothetical protein
MTLAVCGALGALLVVDNIRLRVQLRNQRRAWAAAEMLKEDNGLVHFGSMLLPAVADLRWRHRWKALRLGSVQVARDDSVRVDGVQFKHDQRLDEYARAVWSTYLARTVKTSTRYK